MIIEDGTIQEQLTFLLKQNKEIVEAINRHQSSTKFVQFVPSTADTNSGLSVSIENRVALTPIEKRFNRLIQTRLGSRVMLPSFGSKLHELIDKSVNHEFKLLFRHYLADAFFRPDGEAWDKELVPDSIKVEEITDTELSVSVIMKNGKVFESGY